MKEDMHITIKGVARVIGAVALFALSLAGIYYHIDYSGWGIFLAVLMIPSDAD